MTCSAVNSLFCLRTDIQIEITTKKSNGNAVNRYFFDHFLQTTCYLVVLEKKSRRNDTNIPVNDL